mmetsp:Transcript_34054/g.78534  ORF Transcript_34054/g.78534 Transcript_34054/m.78534 type:complete len:209 (+) Transcript_34054:1836-2462(+)
MTSIVELFPKCRKLAYDARQRLAQVRNGILDSSELYICLDELENQLKIMDQLVHRETPYQRDVWKRKILELREDGKTMQRQAQKLDRVVNKNKRIQKDREELLRRRRKRPEDESDLSQLAEEAQSLQNSSNMMNELIVTGEASLHGLVHQRQQLRGVRKVVMEMGNRLGLAQATMRIIERRDISDAYLVFAGMIVTCIVIYFCWFHSF